MKYFIVATCLAFFILTEISCKKETIQANQLTGKWNLVNDSTSTTNSCIGCFNGSNYFGSSSDYYNFTVNGILYIQERESVDTAAYSMVTNNQVTITTDYAVNGGGVFIYSLGFTGSSLPLSFPIKNLTYSVSNITAHTLTLTTSGTETPATSGVSPLHYIEIIHLKR